MRSSISLLVRLFVFSDRDQAQSVPCGVPYLWSPDVAGVSFPSSGTGGLTFFSLHHVVPSQVAAQEASDCRAKLARDMLELGKIVSVKTGHVSKAT